MCVDLFILAAACFYCQPNRAKGIQYNAVDLWYYYTNVKAAVFVEKAELKGGRV